MEETKLKVKSLMKMAEGREGGVSRRVADIKIDPAVVKFKPEGYNARPLNLERVAMFKQVQRLGGAIPAIGIFKEGETIFVNDGHHRLKAYHELLDEGWDIPFVEAYEVKGTSFDRLLQMVTSADGLPLKPLEQGRMYQRMVAEGGLEEDIARFCGKTLPYVKDLMRLAKSDPAVLAMIDAGTVSADTAVLAVKSRGAGAAEHLKALLVEARAKGVQTVTPNAFKAAKKAEKAEKTGTDAQTPREPAVAASKLSAKEAEAVAIAVTMVGKLGKLLDEPGPDVELFGLSLHPQACKELLELSKQFSSLCKGKSSDVSDVQAFRREFPGILKGHKTSLDKVTY